MADDAQEPAAGSDVGPSTAAAEPAVAELAEPAKPKREPPGFRKSTLKKGDKKNFPKAKDKVKVQYLGKLEDGTQFDSSYDAKKKKQFPLTFTVGIGQVIRGWDEALLQMSVGEKAEVKIVNPEFAYGAKGKPPVIPPNAVLTFEIELLEICG